MKQLTQKFLAAVCALGVVLSFSACGNTTTPSEPQNQKTSVKLVADFSNGAVGAAESDRIKEETVEVEGEVDITVLAAELSSWSGLDFTLNDARVESDAAYVDWAVSSTLTAGLDEREQKEEFHFFDAVSLNWFMMDSLAQTIKQNLNVQTVYYSMDGGKELAFQNAEDMAAQGLAALPVDQPYEGSVFFVSHAGGMGDIGDNGLAYWNGLNFGPNLFYSEEVPSTSDAGEYLNAAEAAIHVFEQMHERFDEYSETTEYLMTLMEIAAINEEECYVYSCVWGETSGIGLAYAYQSGNIYIQGQAGEWVTPA